MIGPYVKIRIICTKSFTKFNLDFLNFRPIIGQILSLSSVFNFFFKIQDLFKTYQRI